MADWGMKVSKPGVDVGTADAASLIMSSSFNLLKTASVGIFSGAGVVSHGLAYAPMFFNFAQGGTLARVRLSANGGADSSNLTFEGTTVKKYYVFYQNAA